MSYIVAGIALFGLMVGLYHLVEGPAVVGGWLIGASVSALVTAALLDGVARAVHSLERIERKMRR